MKLYVSPFLAFLAGAAILSLTLSYSAPKGYALEIVNQKSDRHVKAAETGAFFVPAPGLTLADSLGGFESRERNIQVIVANFGAPLSEIAKGFTEETFRAMGMDMKSRGEFTVNGTRAFLFKVLHPNGGTNWGKWIMLAENGDNTLTVNAVFVSGDTSAASDLEAMLKSVYMEAPRPVFANPPGGISERPVSEYVSMKPPAPNALSDEAPPQSAAKGSDAVSPDKPVQKTKARIVTEDGIISAEDVPTGTPDGE